MSGRQPKPPEPEPALTGEARALIESEVARFAALGQTEAMELDSDQLAMAVTAAVSRSAGYRQVSEPDVARVLEWAWDHFHGATVAGLVVTQVIDVAVQGGELVFGVDPGNPNAAAFLEAMKADPRAADFADKIGAALAGKADHGVRR